jgi:hypothetical protein
MEMDDTKWLIVLPPALQEWYSYLPPRPSRSSFVAKEIAFAINVTSQEQRLAISLTVG